MKLRFPGTVAGLADATDRLRGFLDGVTVTTARRYQIELAFDEIAANIIRHAQPVSDINVDVTLDGSQAVLTFEDDGPPFDPRSHVPRPLDTDLEHAHVGGLGLRLVRTFTIQFDYERTPDRRNRLTVAIPVI